MPRTDSYFDEDLDQDPRAQNAEEPSEAKDEEVNQQTALIPKSALMGKKVAVGDKLTVKVTGIFEDEVEIVCVYGKNREAEREPVPASDADALME